MKRHPADIISSAAQLRREDLQLHQDVSLLQEPETTVHDAGDDEY
jgi:hypothetical protein